MSKDTTAFLAGFALSMVAVVTFFKNDATTPSGAQITPVPPSAFSVPASPSQSSDGYSDDLRDVEQGWVERDLRLGQDLEQQKLVASDIRSQIDKQQRDTESLRQQLSQQQGETQKLIAQLQDEVREQNRLINDLYARQQDQRVSSQLREVERDNRILGETRLTDPGASQSLSSEDLFTGIKTVVVWFAGAIALIMVIGGIVVVIMILVVLVLPGRRSPQPKTLERRSVPTIYYPAPPRRLMSPESRDRYTDSPRYPRESSYAEPNYSEDGSYFEYWVDVDSRRY